MPSILNVFALCRCNKDVCEKSLPHLGMSMCSVSAQFRCQILICTVEGVCGSIEHACVAVVSNFSTCTVQDVYFCDSAVS